MDEPSPWAIALQLCVAAVIIGGVYWFILHRSADFIIDVRRGEVRSKGKISLAVLQRLTPFLLEDLAIRDYVRIYGVQRGPRISVWFRGRLSPGEQQRIRNFLASGA